MTEYGQRGVTRGFRIVKFTGKKDEQGRDLCIEIVREGGKRNINITVIPCPEWLYTIKPPPERPTYTKEEKEEFRRTVRRLEMRDKILDALKKGSIRKIYEALHDDPEAFNEALRIYFKSKMVF